MRFGAVFVPNGAITEQWIPSTPGVGFEFTPIRSRWRISGSVGRGEQSHPGQSRSRGRRSRDQRRRISHRCVPEENRGGNVGAGVSIDQLVARQIGQDTPFPSSSWRRRTSPATSGVHERIQLRLHQHDLVELATTPQPMEFNPAHGLRADVRSSRHAGAARGTPAAQPECPGRHRRASQRPAARARPARSTRLDEYLQNVREIERRIQRAVAKQHHCRRGAARRHPRVVRGHVTLMYELLAVATRPT